ncbi:polyhydroxyalkanoic acid system family protein [Sphingomonas baiyangensis]|uniref:Polyhydroxyalkanoic acid system protein n=1 Tax=Sphingomonas baiyangensis TaxID=2572576 RepID=A0A4U1L109_9SPHN|nr:polyhydroxyalkanoic acid system family protein [Sphingomonas baiyangensis]TKD50471.1 hypothetical protein FBR43_06630 [Sphingomonas baiyangensis]
MTDPITVDIPHNLDNAEVRRRIDGGTGKLAEMFPGGSITEHRWASDDVFEFTVAALGQRVAARIELLEGRARATIDLPPFLALFADKLRAKLQREAPKLLR